MDSRKEYRLGVLFPFQKKRNIKNLLVTNQSEPSTIF